MIKDREIEIINTEHGEFTNNEVTGQTADEVYQEYLKPPNNQHQPNKMEVRLRQQEAAMELLATQIAKNTLLQGGK